MQWTKPSIDKINKTIMIIDVAECVQCDLNHMLWRNYIVWMLPNQWNDNQAQKWQSKRKNAKMQTTQPPVVHDHENDDRKSCLYNF